MAEHLTERRIVQHILDTEDNAFVLANQKAIARGVHNAVMAIQGNGGIEAYDRWYEAMSQLTSADCADTLELMRLTESLHEKYQAKSLRLCSRARTENRIHQTVYRAVHAVLNECKSVRTAS